VYRGTADQLAFDRALQTVGLSERNMQVINLDWSAGKPRWPPVAWMRYGAASRRWRCAAIRLTWWCGDSGRQNTTQAAFLGTQDFIQAWPQATQQIIDVLVKNAAEISDPANREAWSAEMAQQSQIPQALFLEELQPQDLNFSTSPRIDPS
jgi:sulfonate transport system substrate-binding protein